MTESLIHEIDAAIAAHATWKLRLKTAISTGRVEQNVDTVRRCDQCAFGEWLKGPTLSDEVRAGKPFEVVYRLHADFHRIAADVLAAVAAGKPSAAQEILDGPFSDKSRILVVALNKWRNELRAAV